MNFIIYIGIFILLIIGIIWLISKVKGESAKAEAEYVPVPEPVMTEADRNLPMGRLMEKGLLQTADLVENLLKRGRKPFFEPMRFIDRDGNYSLRAEAEDGDLYIIETKKRPQFQDMYQQIYDDLRAEKERLKEQGSEKMVRVIVCTNDPSSLVLEAAAEDPAVEIYNMFPEFQYFKDE
jgi:putative NIF3 family GTP cyclohydrolase 1 type 2